MAAKFRLGTVLITPTALEVLYEKDIHWCLVRHMDGDWGDVSSEDKAENELSLRQGFRLFSSYHDRNKTKFWIITEADRSSTTILLPNDY